MSRRATCRCGQLSATCAGDPIRISACHCLACKQRSGSAFATQARYPADRVTIDGRSTAWTRIADSGRSVVYHFCPVCGSTVWYQSGPIPDAIAIPVGNFADPAFPGPGFSVWESRRCAWVEIGGEVAHSD